LHSKRQQRVEAIRAGCKDWEAVASSQEVFDRAGIGTIGAVAIGALLEEAGLQKMGIGPGGYVFWWTGKGDPPEDALKRESRRAVTRAVLSARQQLIAGAIDRSGRAA
jgi:hypothetical protein